MRIKTHLQKFSIAIATLATLFYTIKVPSIATNHSLLIASMPAVVFAIYIGIYDTIDMGFNPPIPMYILITISWAFMGTKQVETELSGSIAELLSTVLGVAIGVVGFYFLVIFVEIIIYSVSGKGINGVREDMRQETDDAYGDPYAEKILDED